MNINTADLHIQNFYAIKEGIKPVLRTGTESGNINPIKDFCKKHNLHLLIKPTRNIPSFMDSISTYPCYILYISLDSKLAKEAYEAEKNGNEKN